MSMRSYGLALSVVRKELMTYQHNPDLNIANMKRAGAGWIFAVVTQYSGSRLTVNDGYNSVVVTLRSADKRVHAGILTTLRSTLLAGSMPAVAIKLQYNKLCRTASVWRPCDRSWRNPCIVLLERKRECHIPALQPSPEINWRDITDATKKYRAYLASRDWALKKLAVRERSGGHCERKCGRKATQVHHQTYINIYNEGLEDLLHVCGPCHAYLSGRTHSDPSARQ